MLFDLVKVFDFFIFFSFQQFSPSVYHIIYFKKAFRNCTLYKVFDGLGIKTCVFYYMFFLSFNILSVKVILYKRKITHYRSGV